MLVERRYVVLCCARAQIVRVLHGARDINSALLADGIGYPAREGGYPREAPEVRGDFWIPAFEGVKKSRRLSQVPCKSRGFRLSPE
jgi:hypothetical protein